MLLRVVGGFLLFIFRSAKVDVSHFVFMRSCRLLVIFRGDLSLACLLSKSIFAATIGLPSISF